MAKLDYVLDDLRTASPKDLPGRAESWARIIVGKRSPESFAVLLGVIMPLDKSIQPYCVSRQHFEALADVGLATATDVLSKSPDELVALLSSSVEAAVLATAAAFCVAVDEAMERTVSRTERYGPLYPSNTWLSTTAAPQDLYQQPQDTSVVRKGEIRGARVASHQSVISDGKEMDAETRRLIRKWARAKGYKVGGRGRLSADLVDAYLKSSEGNAECHSIIANSGDDGTELSSSVVREWARAKGYRVGDRGRVPTWMVDAFRREQRGLVDTAAEPAPFGAERRTLEADAFFDFLRGV